MKRRLGLIFLLVFAFLAGSYHLWSATVTKGLIGKNDISLWYTGDSAASFSRESSTGYSLTLQKLDWVGIDAGQVWGGGVNKNRAVLVSAQSDIDTSSYRNLWLGPGTWTIDDDLSFSSYPNLTITMAPGATFSISSGKTLTLYSPENINAGVRQKIKTGDGSLVFSKIGNPPPYWFGFSTAETGANNMSYLQEAVDSVEATDVQGTVSARVHIPPGTYAMDTTAGSVNLDSNFSGIIGTNRSTRFNVTGNNPVFVLNSGALADGTITRRAININGIYFRHTTEDYSANTATAIKVRDVQKSNISDNWFAYFYKAIDSAARDTQHIFRNQFSQCGYGIYMPDWFTSPMIQDEYIEFNVFEACRLWDIYLACDWADIWITANEFAHGSNSGDSCYFITGVTNANQGLYFNENTWEAMVAGGKGVYLNDVNTKVAHDIKFKNDRFTDTDMVAITGERVYYAELDGVYFAQTASDGGAAYNFDANSRIITFKSLRYSDTGDLPTRTVASLNTYTEQFRKVIYRAMSVVNTSTHGSDETLRSTTINGDSLHVGGIIRVTAFGQITGANDTKVIKVKFGNAGGLDEWTVVNAAAGDATDFEISAVIGNYATGTQSVLAKGTESDGTLLLDVDNAAEDTTADCTVAITANIADATDTDNVALRGMIVELLQGEQP